MEEEIGIVKKTEGINARILIQKKGVCEGCNVQGACESTSEGSEIEVLNTIQAKVGQTVRIAFKPYTYLKGTILIYGIPLVLFIAGSVVGKNIGEKYMENISSDIVAAIAGFALLFLSVLGIRIWSSRADKKTEYKPVIEKILN